MKSQQSQGCEDNPDIPDFQPDDYPEPEPSEEDEDET